MSDFAADLASILEGGLAVDAVYTPGGGSPVAVRVIRLSPDETLEFGQSIIRTETTRLTASVVAVPNPTSGDTFTIGAEVLVVQGVPSRDSRRLRWLIEASQQ